MLNLSDTDFVTMSHHTIAKALKNNSGLSAIIHFPEKKSPPESFDSPCAHRAAEISNTGGPNFLCTNGANTPLAIASLRQPHSCCANCKLRVLMKIFLLISESQLSFTWYDCPGFEGCCTFRFE